MKLLQDEKCEVKHGDFFQFDWASLVNQFNRGTACTWQLSLGNQLATRNYW
jgi:hypothetical protein